MLRQMARCFRIGVLESVGLRKRSFYIVVAGAWLPAKRCWKRNCACGAGEPFPRAAMYYKFNSFTQRLVGAGASSAYIPQGLKPVVPFESPPLIFGSPTKLVSDASPTDQYFGKNKVPELQKFFQKPDGLPVYLKRGLPDKLLYRTTMALTIGGTIYCLIALYMAAQPQRPK